MRVDTIGRRIRSLFNPVTILAFFFSPAALAQPTTFTSPIDITGGRIAFEAVAPDRETGAMVPIPIPSLGPGVAELTGGPINLVFDRRWNGTPDQQAAGTSPRQQACDGPEGLRAQVMARIAQQGETAYDISCNFATAGSVFVQQLSGALVVSYQLFNNTATFRTTSPISCHPESGNVFCPNDPRFTLRFATELTFLIWTGSSMCGLQAEPPTSLLHGVQIEAENAAASMIAFADAAFGDQRFMAAELAIQARSANPPLSMGDAFTEIQAACSGGPAAVVSRFSQLDTEVRLPQGVVFRAVHPGIAPPRFQNVALPFGQYTCVSGFVWRGAYDGDIVCVTPEVRDQTANDNALADARRSPTGGDFGPATCRPGFVWRTARAEDLICVTPETRDQVAADNASAASRWVLGAPVPSFTRPSITAQPVVAAGASFEVSGQFFPTASDPSRLQLALDRDATAACFGGSTQLEQTVGGVSSVSPIAASANSMSSCSFRHELVGLQPATQYRFRARDCDAVTCSPWSDPFETVTPSGNDGPRPVVLVLDAGPQLGTVGTDTSGSFAITVQMPPDTPPGMHSLTASTGTSSDTIGIEVTGPGSGTARLIVTGTFFGDQGCPMREIEPPAIATSEPFSLFGTGFTPGQVTIFLDSPSGLNLGTATVGADGTFCSDSFAGPPFELRGDRNLVGVQDGMVKVTLPTKVVFVRPIG